MAKFLAGVICGVVLAFAVPALALVTVQGNGTLVGWTIIAGPDRAEALSCDILYVWTNLRQIECINA